MGILSGKHLLVSGVLTKSSIAFHVAGLAQEQGADVTLTAYPRVSLVERLARLLPRPAAVIPLDVTDPESLAGLAERVGRHTGTLDGVLHSIAYAPPAALGGNFPGTGWPDVAATLHASTYSLHGLVTAVLPLLRSPGGSVVGLDFDASVAWPEYDWMGVAKSGLESCARYLAFYLGAQGIRVNLVAAGPLRTMAASNISRDGDGAGDFAALWHRRAPLGWDETNADPVARACVALFSDWFPATTGEIVHVDGGAHAVG
ncbi:enoyl-[acyl-carrier-protein] reductase [NADH] [Streptosporangium violaceochromogenes]|nr:enoyl-[acyl-carrier-protein] reductase [NADH] [Streptosporangium violaceochromogenes]